MQGKKSYQERLFISFQLSDYVPLDNFYRRVKEVLDFTFLYEATKHYYGTEGQQSVDPTVFMKLMLVGYIENINSDRRIIEMCRMRMDILYFLGYDLDESLPWHSTLNRTRKLYGEQIFKSIFQAVLKQCIEKGMLSGKRQAVDSALIRANVSVDSLTERQILDDGALYSKELDANIEEKALKQPTLKPVASDSKPKRVRVRKDRNPPRSNTTHYSPVDTDARFTRKPGKPFSMYSLKKVPEAQREKDFTYDVENDRYFCQRGVAVSFRPKKGTSIDRDKTYRSKAKDCRGCPLVESCCGKKNYRTIVIWGGINQHNSTTRMHDRMKTKYGKKMKYIRSGSVEPVIGTLINYTGMRRIQTKGLKQANKCMLLSAAAYNLKKFLRFKVKTNIPNIQPKNSAKLKNVLNSKLTLLLSFWRSPNHLGI